MAHITMESMPPSTNALNIALLVGLKFIMRFIFRSAKEHPDECEATRKDVDRRLSAALHEWCHTPGEN